MHSIKQTLPERMTPDERRAEIAGLLTLPSGETTPRRWDGEPTPLQLALARGHRWLATLESGAVKSLRDIARKEGVDSSYVSRMGNLTTLALDIVEGILDETLSPELTLFDLAVEPPAAITGAAEYQGSALAGMRLSRAKAVRIRGSDPTLSCVIAGVLRVDPPDIRCPRLCASATVLTYNPLMMKQVVIKGGVTQDESGCSVMSPVS